MECMMSRSAASARRELHALTEDARTEYLNEAQACVRLLRAQGMNYPNIQLAYVAAALAIIDGRFKFANGKSNLTAAAREFGKATKNSCKDVSAWVKRLEDLGKALSSENLESAMSQLQEMPTDDLVENCLEDQAWLHEVLQTFEESGTTVGDLKSQLEAEPIDEPTHRGWGNETDPFGCRALLYKALTDGNDVTRSPSPTRRVMSREAQVQQRSVVAIVDSTGAPMSSAFVVHISDTSIFIAASAHGVLALQGASCGVPLGYDTAPIKAIGREAIVKYISFPDKRWFRTHNTPRQDLERSWREVQSVVIDEENERDLVILELSREGEPCHPNGTPLLRELRFMAAAPLEGKDVFMFGYGESGPRQSGTNITSGKLSSVDTMRGWVRYSGGILCAHSGAPLVAGYKNDKGHDDFAALGYAVHSITGELGNCRPIAYVQEAMAALHLPLKELIELPSDVLSNSSRGTSRSMASHGRSRVSLPQSEALALSDGFVVITESDRFAASDASAAYSQTTSEIACDARGLTPSEIDAVEGAADHKAAEAEAAAAGSPDSVVPLSRVPTSSHAPRALERTLSVGSQSEYNPVEGMAVHEAQPVDALKNVMTSLVGSVAREKERADLAEKRARLADFKHCTSEYIKEFTLAASGDLREGPRGAMFYLRLGMLPEHMTLKLAKFLAVICGYRDRYRFTPRVMQGALTRTDTPTLKAKDSRPYHRLVRGMLARRPHARKHLAVLKLQARRRAMLPRRQYLRSREVIETVQAVARLRRFRRAKRLQAAARRFVALSHYRQVRCLAVSSERLVRGFLARRAYSRAREAATRLQAMVRRFVALSHHRQVRCLAVNSERLVRGFLDRRTYSRAREAATRLQAMVRRGVLRLAWQRAQQDIRRACITRDASRNASRPSLTDDEKRRILHRHLPQHMAEAREQRLTHEYEQLIARIKTAAVTDANANFVVLGRALVEIEQELAASASFAQASAFALAKVVEGKQREAEQELEYDALNTRIKQLERLSEMCNTPNTSRTCFRPTWLVPGTVVVFYNPHAKRCIRMCDGDKVNTLGGNVEFDGIPPPRDWISERFAVVDAGDGEWAFYSLQWRRFLRMNTKNCVDGSPESEEHALPHEWDGARFTVVDTGDGMIGLHSRCCNRFVKVDGSDRDAVRPSQWMDATSHPKQHWPCERFKVKADDSSARQLLELALGRQTSRPVKIRQLDRFNGKRYLTDVPKPVYTDDPTKKCKGDRRNDHSSYAIVHTEGPTEDLLERRRWQFIPVDGKPSHFYLKVWGEHERYLAAHQHKALHKDGTHRWNDTRSQKSSYVCVHYSGEESKPYGEMRTEWKLVRVEGQPNAFTLQAQSHGAIGRYLAAHNRGRNQEYPDYRNDGSSYVIVHDIEPKGSEHVWAGKWELSVAM